MKAPIGLIIGAGAMIAIAVVAFLFAPEQLTETTISEQTIPEVPPPSPARRARVADKANHLGPRALFTRKYDGDIKRAVDIYWPEYPFWRSWKAQLYQESRLNPDAVSPVGARGLAQFMPGTWQEVSLELNLIGLSPNSDIAIEAGAYYMAKMRRFWSSPRPEEERQRLAQASYNAGAGNIIRAQKLCDGARSWEQIEKCLPQVTGASNAHETQTYVSRIERWRIALEME